MTAKQTALLRWLGELGMYDGRTLRLGEAMTAVSLRRRGLVRSFTRANGETVWSITQRGLDELHGVV